MMKGLVFRSAAGDVINIGPWDYLTTPEVNDDTGEITWVINNPLPEGATSTDEEVIPDGHGGFMAANP